MKRTISFMTGKGSVNHNSRKFRAKNIDSERSYLNVEYCNEDVKDVYHELFDEALVRYNEKQTRSDRKIDDYYDKICFGKQEKPFHEIILQIGDKDNMGAQQKTDSLLQRCLMNICVIFKDGILRYGYFLRTCTWMKRHRIYILILYHIRQEAKEDSIQEFL